MTGEGVEESPSTPALRLASAVDRLVREDGARVGFVLDPGGHVTAASGEPSGLDPVGFAALAAAQAWAARDLASTVVGFELSRLVQRGRGTSVTLVSLAGDRLLALLHDRNPDGEAGWRGAVPDVSEVSRAADELDRWNAETRAESGAAGEEWARAAEDRIDRIFQGGG